MTDDDMLAVAWAGARAHDLMVHERIDRLRQRLGEDSREGYALLELRSMLYESDLSVAAARQVVSGRKVPSG